MKNQIWISLLSWFRAIFFGRLCSMPLMLQFSSKINAMASTTGFSEAHQTPFCGPSLPRAPDPETHIIWHWGCRSHLHKTIKEEYTNLLIKQLEEEKIYIYKRNTKNKIKYEKWPNQAACWGRSNWLNSWFLKSGLLIEFYWFSAKMWKMRNLSRFKKKTKSYFNF